MTKGITGSAAGLIATATGWFANLEAWFRVLSLAAGFVLTCVMIRYWWVKGTNAKQKRNDMKKNTTNLMLTILSFTLAMSPLVLLAQSTTDTQAVSEESVFALLKAMVMQVINSPASLLVIIGLSVIAVVFEVVEWLPSKGILPLCVFGGMGTYWLFSSPASVPPHFPHPQAVLAVNGLVCGMFAFIAHITVVRWLMSKMPQKPAPPNG